MGSGIFCLQMVTAPSLLERSPFPGRNLWLASFANRCSGNVTGGRRMSAVSPSGRESPTPCGADAGGEDQAQSGSSAAGTQPPAGEDGLTRKHGSQNISCGRETHQTQSCNWEGQFQKTISGNLYGLSIKKCLAHLNQHTVWFRKQTNRCSWLTISYVTFLGQAHLYSGIQHLSDFRKIIQCLPSIAPQAAGSGAVAQNQTQRFCSKTGCAHKPINSLLTGQVRFCRQRGMKRTLRF